MIDIHTHILPFVDDGSKSLSDSIKLVKTAYEQGVEAIILTPHHRSPYFESAENIKKTFDEFCDKVKELNLPVKLFLGQEVHICSGIVDLYKQNKVLTIANTNYCLIEFDFNTYCDIPETVYELKKAGYIPIVAHFERYHYATLEDAFEVKRMGGLIQVNAESVLGGFFKNREERRRVHTLFMEECVDFVASDSHVVRKYDLKRAGELVKKKYGEDAYNTVFSMKAKNMLKGQI